MATAPLNRILGQLRVSLADNQFSYDNFLVTLGQSRINFSGSVSLSGNLNTVTSALDVGAGPAAGATRYFKLGMQLPTNASNTLQGEEALFALTWHMTG